MATSNVIPNTSDPNFPLRVFTQGDVNIINNELQNSRANRVRATLYPDTMAKPQDVSHLRMDPEIPSALEQFAPACAELREALDEIINYQLEADFAANFIPEIVKLLGDEDKNVVRNASELTRNLTHSEAASTVASTSPLLVNALIKAINNANGETMNDSLIKEAATGALHNLSKYEQGRLTLFKAGGIPILVLLLESPAERVVNYAISSLHNLLNYQEGSKLAVRIAGGIQKMVPLLKSKDQKFLAYNIDCLQMLAYGDPGSKLAILNCNGPRELVMVFKNKQADEKLIWTASRLLKVLSTCKYSKEQIVEYGGFEAIVNRLDPKLDEKLFFNCITTLRNLSDAETNFRCDDQTVAYLLQLLRNGNEELVTFMIETLSNLSAKKPRIKQSIFRTGGLEIFLQLLRAFSKDEIREPTLCCLRHLTSHHSCILQVHREFIQLGGLEQVISIFQSATNWPILKVSCGLLRNLATCEENHQEIVSMEVIQRMAQILALAVKDERQTNSLRREKSLTDSMRNLKINKHLVEGVDLDDVIESAIATLALLGNASMVNSDAISELNVQPLILRLESDPDTAEGVATACRSLLEALNVPESSRYAAGSTLDRRSMLLDSSRSSFISRGSRDQLSQFSSQDRLERGNFKAPMMYDSMEFRNKGSMSSSLNHIENTDKKDDEGSRIYENVSPGYETIVDENSLKTPSYLNVLGVKDKKKKKKTPETDSLNQTIEI